jgi:3-methyladenine DNA glycosylase/8-oxoguanine DNA glycosylase
VELREEVAPPAGPGSFLLPRRTGADGLTRRRGGVLERLLHYEDAPVVVRVAQPAPDTVLFGARAPSRAAAAYGIRRMRFALGVDEDLRGFLRRFARDPVIGPSLRRRPWLRVGRRPEPFEALVWAICEQLIEYERAAAIERRIVAALGRRGAGWHGAGWRGAGGRGAGWRGAGGRGADGRGAGRQGAGRQGAGRQGAGRQGADWHGAQGDLSDLPAASALAGTAPALLQSFDLAGARALALVRAAREIARGRVDLHSADHERAWRRLRAIPDIGSWTVEMLALHGQGRHDQVPAGDLGLLKRVGRLLSGGDPRARAQEPQVRELLAPYGEWAGLAATHLLAL